MTSPDDTPTDAAANKEEARRKFREALDKKAQEHHGQGSGAGPAATHPHTSPARPRRTFRRKAGG